MLKVKIRKYMLEIIIFLIGLITGLSINNWDFIETNYFVILAVILFIAIIFYIRFKNHKEITDFEDSLYHLIYGISYEELVSSEYSIFEYQVYETITDEFGSDSLIFILRFSTNDNLSKIGMILYHPTGVYCIDLRCYDGKINGSSESATWVLTNEEGDYEVNNPVLDNKLNIENLNELYSFDYENIVLVPESTVIEENIENVFHLEEFIELLHNKVNMYTINDYNEIMTLINNYENKLNDKEDILDL